MKMNLRTLLVGALTATVLGIGCDSANEKPSESTATTAIPADWVGAYYTAPGSIQAECKMGIQATGEGIFVGPVPGPDRSDIKGSFTADGSKLHFSGAGAELDFERKEDGSFAYAGDLPQLKGLVLVRG